jgi:hypothetical protein
MHRTIYEPSTLEHHLEQASRNRSSQMMPPLSPVETTSQHWTLSPRKRVDVETELNER